MKIKLLSLLCLFPLWVFSQDCDVTDQCIYTFNLSDTGGDGWNGNTMTVSQNGNTVAVLSLETGASASVSVALCDNEPFELYWNEGGSMPQEVAVAVVNSFSQTIYTKQPDMGEQNTALYEYLVQCAQDMCYSPYNVQVETEMFSAIVSWAGPEVGNWEYYATNDPNDIPDYSTIGTPINVNPFELTDLTPGMTYFVYVRQVCDSFGGALSYSQWTSSGVFFIPGNDDEQDYHISGTVRADIDDNGSCDEMDIPVPNMEIQVSLNAVYLYSVYTNVQGEYYMGGLPEGENIYMLQPVVPDGFDEIAPIAFPVNFDAENTEVVADICLPQPDEISNDIQVTIMPLGIAQPGFLAHYVIYVENNSILPAENVTVALSFDNERFEVGTVGNDYTVTDENTILISVGDIAPLQNSIVIASFHVFEPPVNVGGEYVLFNAYAAMDATDNDVTNNYFTLNQMIVNSYDPNSVVVAEGDMIGIEDVIKYVHYTINFQNLGTAPAINIIVENELDANFDWDTFEPLASSHNYSLTRSNAHLEFTFNGINLPDSTADEPASHGYITYRIKPKADIQQGDIVNNTANIYFDFNPAITTNTATSEFYAVLLGADNQQVNNVLLYPNPVKDILYINTKADEVINVTIYDLNGRKCLTAEGAAIHVETLKAGLYFVNITTQSGNATYKLIKQ